MTMENQEVLMDERLRNRVINAEYGGITEEKIRAIYIEETGKEPPITIEVYNSEDYIDNQDSYGFNGTIIHFLDEEKGINQTYTIPRGSEKGDQETGRPDDWLYNIMGVFLGKDASQYDAARRFEQKVRRIISRELKGNNSEVDLKRIGLGHSLGGNLITLQQLVNKDFDNVYTVNAAAPTTYQLAEIEYSFWMAVSEEFKLNLYDKDEIYHVDPAALERFAEDYYEEAGENIEHLTVKQDILQALGGLRGFFKVGTYIEPIDACPGTETLEALIQKIPDEDIKAIQIYLAKYSMTYNEQGFDGVVREMTGFDWRLVDQFSEYENIDYDPNLITLVRDGISSYSEMKVKIPELLGKLKVLHENIDPILETLAEIGYVTAEEREVILEEISGIEEDLKGIQSAIKPDILMVLPGIQLIRLGYAFRKVKKHFGSIGDRLDRIYHNTAYLQELFSKSASAHGRKVVIEALCLQAGRSYTASGDLLVQTTRGGKMINVNISSAVRIYLKGIAVLDEKEMILNQMIRRYERVYVDGFEKRITKLVNKIDDMENNPSQYQQMLGRFTDDTKLFYKLTRIRVHDEINPLPNDGFKRGFENKFEYMWKEIEKGREFIRSVRESIEDLFDREEGIAQKINLKGETNERARAKNVVLF